MWTVVVVEAVAASVVVEILVVVIVVVAAVNLYVSIIQPTFSTNILFSHRLQPGQWSKMMWTVWLRPEIAVKFAHSKFKFVE